MRPISRTSSSSGPRLAAEGTATRTRLEAKRTRIERERQRTIDLVIRGIIGEEDARDRIAELKAQRAEVDAELATLDQAPSMISLHPATLERYSETVDRLAKAVIEHAAADDDRGPLVQSFRALVHSVTIHPKGHEQGSRSR
ncbi:hypothetical protein ACFQU1_11085 [Chelatococcus sp. GCM10030263]|uniref:hypothetical protein n=1 Tax=Chelatococcus sp. GCM10030263 TaxID=3273387 RepID=UPI003610FC0B